MEDELIVCSTLRVLIFFYRHFCSDEVLVDRWEEMEATTIKAMYLTVGKGRGSAVIVELLSRTSGLVFCVS
jgi:hypothetical protein